MKILSIRLSPIALRLILLFLIVALGGVIRFWKISSLPFPPNGDELAFGYYGWSLLHYQTDEYGHRFPFYFSSIGDYKYPVLAYMNVLPAALFGLTEITSRFTSAVSGIVLIVVGYLLTWIIFKSSPVAILSALFLALSPWGISLSRYGYETNVSLTLTTAGFLALFWIGHGNTTLKRRLWLFFSSFILLTTATFCYGAAKVTVPALLLVIFLASLFKFFSLRPIRIYTAGLLIIISSIVALSLVPWQSRGRASGVLLLGITPDHRRILAEDAIEAGISPVRLPVKVTYLFHNKYKALSEFYLQRYLKYFESDFLFFGSGAANESIPQAGVLLLVQIIFLPVGLLALLNRVRHNGKLVIPLLWLLVAPLPAVITVGEGHLTRALLMLPMLSAISGLGLIHLVSFFKSNFWKIISVTGFFMVIGLNSSFILSQLFVHKPVRQAWKNEQVYKQLVSSLYEFKPIYKFIAIPDNDYIFFLYYMKVSPPDFLARSTIKPETYANQWERVDRLDNIYFKMPYKCPKEGKLNVLYICQGQHIPINSRILKVIRYLDGIPAFVLIEFLPVSPKNYLPPQLPPGVHYMVDWGSRYPNSLIPATDPALW